MSQNRLKLAVGSLDLDLSGDAEYIEQAYDGMQSVLLDCYRECLHAEMDEAPASPDNTQPLYAPEIQKRARALHLAGPRADAPEDAQDRGHEGHLHLVLCGDIYNKLLILEREEFDESIFGQALNSGRILRVYVDRNQQDRFAELFQFGKVLWRELTAAGKAAVRGGD